VRHFVIFLLFASSAFSERPRISPVRAVLVQNVGATSSPSNASLESLAAGIGVDRRPAAKSALDAIDRRSLSLEEFGELSQAYVLLGFIDEAILAGNDLPSSDPRIAAGLSQAASAAANRSEYAQAVRLANEALRLDPGDRAATAVLD
jgi:tetratricopeptide (TPR) repeat protein